MNLPAGANIVIRVYVAQTQKRYRLGIKWRDGMEIKESFLRILPRQDMPYLT